MKAGKLLSLEIKMSGLIYCHSWRKLTVEVNLGIQAKNWYFFRELPNVLDKEINNLGSSALFRFSSSISRGGVVPNGSRIYGFSPFPNPVRKSAR